MSGNERESPTRGVGFESLKSTTGLCKKIWKRDYGEEIPEEVLRMVIRLTSAILEAQAGRCRAEMTSMFPRPRCVEACSLKHEIEIEHTIAKMSNPSADPSSRSDSQYAQGDGSQNGTYSPRVSPVLAKLATLDTLKLKRRWCRQFEADISELSKPQLATAPQPILDILKSIGEDPDSRETRQGVDDSEHAVNDRKKKKVVRFVTSPPEIIDSSAKSISSAESISSAKSMIANGGAELLSISIRNASATENSQRQKKLNIHEELNQEVNSFQDTKSRGTIDHAETRKRKLEDGYAIATVQ